MKHMIIFFSCMVFMFIMPVQAASQEKQKSVQQLIEQFGGGTKASEPEKKVAQASMPKFKTIKELQDYYGQEMANQDQLLMEIFSQNLDRHPKLGPLTQELYEARMKSTRARQLHYDESDLERLRKAGDQNKNHIMAEDMKPTAKDEALADKWRLFAKQIFEQEQFPVPEIFFEHRFKGGGAQVTPLFIKIYMQDYANPSDNEIKGVLLHELAHLIYDDVVTNNTQGDLAISSQNPHFKNWFMQLRQFFTEKRADIYAATRGLEYAQGLIDNFKQHEGTPAYYQESDSDHQSNANRTATLQQISKELLELRK